MNHSRHLKVVRTHLNINLERHQRRLRATCAFGVSLDMYVCQTGVSRVPVDNCLARRIRNERGQLGMARHRRWHPLNWCSFGMASFHESSFHESVARISWRAVDSGAVTISRCTAKSHTFQAWTALGCGQRKRHGRQHVGPTHWQIPEGCNYPSLELSKWRPYRYARACVCHQLR